MILQGLFGPIRRTLNRIIVGIVKTEIVSQFAPNDQLFNEALDTIGILGFEFVGFQCTTLSTDLA
jgi:hypothetical protein